MILCSLCATDDCWQNEIVCNCINVKVTKRRRRTPENNDRGTMKKWSFIAQKIEDCKKYILMMPQWSQVNKFLTVTIKLVKNNNKKRKHFQAIFPWKIISRFLWVFLWLYINLYTPTREVKLFAENLIWSYISWPHVNNICLIYAA